MLTAAVAAHTRIFAWHIFCIEEKLRYVLVLDTLSRSFFPTIIGRFSFDILLLQLVGRFLNRIYTDWSESRREVIGIFQIILNLLTTMNKNIHITNLNTIQYIYLYIIHAGRMVQWSQHSSQWWENLKPYSDNIIGVEYYNNSFLYGHTQWWP